MTLVDMAAPHSLHDPPQRSLDQQRHLRGVQDDSESVPTVLGIWGQLPPRWFTNLALHLAQSRVGIRSGHFKREGKNFAGELTLELSDLLTERSELDYAQWLWQRPKLRSALRFPQLDRYHVAPHRDGVYLYVNGVEDETGFLAALLLRLERIGLVPRRVHLETHAGRVHDELVLESLDGTSTSKECLAALPTLLDGLVRVGASSATAPPA